MPTEMEIIRVIEDTASLSGIKLNDSLEDDLGLTSLDRLELAMALEESFNIEISDAQTDEARTVKDVVERVQDLVRLEG